MGDGQIRKLGALEKTCRLLRLHKTLLSLHKSLYYVLKIDFESPQWVLSENPGASSHYPLLVINLLL